MITTVLNDQSARTTKAAGRPRRQNTKVRKKRSSGAAEIVALNEHPMNQHALKLLPKWVVKPEAGQLHMLTLASAAQFAGHADKTMLKKMHREWTPSAVMEYFSRVDTFEELFLAQDRPLEAAQVILAAVNIAAEPNRYLPPLGLT